MMSFEQKTVVVWGLGVSGESAARLLKQKGARVIGIDARAEISAQADLRHLGVELILGESDPKVENVDLVVVSPGVPRLPVFDAFEARGVPVIGEIELASRFVRARLAAITGTNGKSTVTGLVESIFEQFDIEGQSDSHSRTFVGGNYGTPFANAARDNSTYDFVALELSSFQLERVAHFRANVAALLNITHDHGERYETFGDYASAKARIFEGQKTGDIAVLQAGDKVSARYFELKRQPGVELCTFGGADSGANVTVEAAAIVDNKSGLSIATEELQIHGYHNQLNVAAAMLITRLLGLPKHAIKSGVLAFSGLSHRMEFSGSLSGRDFFDDSKATNIGATAAALRSFSASGQSVVLILSGRDKGGALDEITSELSFVRHVVLFGELADRFEEALVDRVPTTRTTDMKSACERALEISEPGDAIVLSPGGSSFDHYRSYKHRGEHFQQVVLELGAKKTDIAASDFGDVE